MEAERDEFQIDFFLVNFLATFPTHVSSYVELDGPIVKNSDHSEHTWMALLQYVFYNGV